MCTAPIPHELVMIWCDTDMLVADGEVVWVAVAWVEEVRVPTRSLLSPSLAGSPTRACDLREAFMHMRENAQELDGCTRMRVPRMRWSWRLVQWKFLPWISFESIYRMLEARRDCRSVTEPSRSTRRGEDKQHGEVALRSYGCPP